MICNNPNHDLNCPYHNNNNALKGASAVNNNNNQQPTKQFVFKQQEVSILSKTLELCKYVIGKNQAQYQNLNLQDFIKELTTASNILSARQNNNSKLKGASSNKNKICNETKIQSLQNLFKQFNLI